MEKLEEQLAIPLPAATHVQRARWRQRQRHTEETAGISNRG